MAKVFLFNKKELEGLIIESLLLYINNFAPSLNLEDFKCFAWSELKSKEIENGLEDTLMWETGRPVTELMFRELIDDVVNNSIRKLF